MSEWWEDPALYSAPKPEAKAKPREWWEDEALYKAPDEHPEAAAPYEPYNPVQPWNQAGHIRQNGTRVPTPLNIPGEAPEDPSILDRIASYPKALAAVMGAREAHQRGGLMGYAGNDSEVDPAQYHLSDPMDMGTAPDRSLVGDPSLGPNTIKEDQRALREQGAELASSASAAEAEARKGLIPKPEGFQWMNPAHSAGYVAQEVAAGAIPLTEAVLAGPAAPAVIGTQAFGDKYAAAIEAGESPETAARAAEASGLVGAATAVLPVSRALAPGVAPMRRAAETGAGMAAGNTVARLADIPIRTMIEGQQAPSFGQALKENAEALPIDIATGMAFGAAHPSTPAAKGALAADAAIRAARANAERAITKDEATHGIGPLSASGGGTREVPAVPVAERNADGEGSVAGVPAGMGREGADSVVPERPIAGGNPVGVDALERATAPAEAPAEPTPAAPLPEAAKPASAAPIAIPEPLSKTKTLYRGDVDAIRAKLTAEGLPPGAIYAEDGKPVGIYTGSRFKADFDRVLLGSNADQARAPQSEAVSAPVEAAASRAGQEPTAARIQPEYRHAADFESRVERERPNLTPQAEQAIRRSFRGEVERDPVTGAHIRKELHPTVKAAQDYAEETGRPAVYVETDLRNLGGLNKAMGSSAADHYLKAFADHVHDALKKAGAETVTIRKGGDEIGAIAVGLPHEKVHEVMAKARDDFGAYAEGKGYKHLPHTKEGAPPGVGLHFGTHEITPGLDIGDIIHRADVQVEARKVGGSYEFGRAFEKAGAGEGAAASAEARAGAEGRGAGPQDEASAGRVRPPKGQAEELTRHGVIPPKRPRNKVSHPDHFDPNWHDALDFLALHGGLDRAEFEHNGVDPSIFKSTKQNHRFFGKPLFRKEGGMSLSDARERLQARGFMPEDAEGSTPHIGDDEALQMILSSLNQDARYYTPAGHENMQRARAADMEYADEQGGIDRAASEHVAENEIPFSKRRMDDQTIDLFSKRPEEAKPAPKIATAFTGDLFGGASARDRVNAAVRAKDDQLRGSGAAPTMRHGEGELFAGPRPAQLKFSKKPASRGLSASEEDRNTVDRVAKEAGKSAALPIHTYHDAAELPERVREATLDHPTEPSVPDAWIDREGVHLFTPGIAKNRGSVTGKTVRQSIAHELYGHHGAETLLGPELHGRFLAGIDRLASRDKVVGDIRKTVERDYAGSDRKADEVLARMAERYEGLGGKARELFDWTVGKIQHAVNKLTGSAFTLNRSDVIDMLRGARKVATTEAGGDVRFSKAGDTVDGMNYREQAMPPTKTTKEWPEDDAQRFALQRQVVEAQAPELEKLAKAAGLKTIDYASGRGHYFMFEDNDYGERVDVRFFKDHAQKAGGGFDPYTGERSGDSDIDITFDPEDGNVSVRVSPDLQKRIGDIQGGKEFVDSVVSKYEGTNLTDFASTNATSSAPRFSKQADDQTETPAKAEEPTYSKRRYTDDQKEAMRKAGTLGDERGLLGKVKDKLGATVAYVRGMNAADIAQSQFDRFHGLKHWEEKVGNIPAEQSGYVAARLSTGAASVLDHVLEFGGVEWKDGVLQPKQGVKSLLDALEPVRGNIADWLSWMVGNRAERLAKEGRENNLTPKDIAELKGLAGENEPAFRQAAADYAAWNKSILDVAEEAGLIDPDSRSVWENADYIPFFRDVVDQFTGPHTGKTLAGQSSGIKSLRGGQEKIKDPLENIIQNAHTLIDAAMKNEAAKRTIDNVEHLGVAEREGMAFKKALIPADQIAKMLKAEGATDAQIKALPPDAFKGLQKLFAIEPPKAPDVIRIMRDGKAEYYKVTDPLLLRALTAFKPANKHAAMRFASWTKRILTAGVTAGPGFIVRNTMRDTLHSYIINPRQMKPALGAMKGVLSAVRRDPTYQRLLAAGALFGHGRFDAFDRAYSAKQIRYALRAKGWSGKDIGDYMGSLVNTPARLWELWHQVGAASENANRIATAKSALKAGDSMASAALEAKDLLDFSMQGDGTMIQFLGDTLPFFNSRIQGMYKLYRAGAIPGRQMRAKVAAKGLMLAAASLGYIAWIQNDPDKKAKYDKLEDFDKDNNWHFWVGDKHFRIPKPFEIGLLYATTAEHAYRVWTGQEEGKKAVKALSKDVYSTLEQNPIPQVVRPIIDVYANKDSFTGRPIEGMADEGLLDSARYDENTSDVMRAVGSKTSDATGYSPKEMEYLWDQYTGTLGQSALALADVAYRHATDAPTKPAMKSAEMPLIGWFMRDDDGTEYTRYQSELYDLAREAEEASRTVNKYKKTGNDKKAEQVAQDYAGPIGFRKKFGSVKKALRDNRNKIDTIMRDTKLTPDEKRRQIDELQRERNKKVAEVYGDYSRTLQGNVAAGNQNPNPDDRVFGGSSEADDDQ